MTLTLFMKPMLTLIPEHYHSSKEEKRPGQVLARQPH